MDWVKISDGLPIEGAEVICRVHYWRDSSVKYTRILRYENGGWVEPWRDHHDAQLNYPIDYLAYIDLPQGEENWECDIYDE